MIKPKLFIGSSSEELPLAEKARDILQSEFDVTIWNERIWDTAVFKINQNFLSDLLKASAKNLFDAVHLPYLSQKLDTIPYINLALADKSLWWKILAGITK